MYEAMTGIYDDLCAMQARKPRVSAPSIATIGASLIAVAWILKWLRLDEPCRQYAASA